MTGVQVVVSIQASIIIRIANIGTKQTIKMKSKIEMHPKTGKKCLIVFYGLEKDNFNEAIEAAHKHHGLERGQKTTIVMPGGLKYEFQSQKKNRSNKKQSEPTKIQKT